jgi:polyhydroxyalkanoate synthase subunit PhaC
MTGTTSSIDPFLKWQQAMLDEGFANLRRMSRLPSLWNRAQNVRKGATPSEVVYEEDRLKVLHYPCQSEPCHKTPLIFVFALVNRPYILDLKPGRSVVSHFVNAGFDTYLIDWGAPSPADRHLTLDDYINGYMCNVADYICERTGASQTSVLGYCMGGTMSAMFTALHQKRIKNLMLLAAGIDFSPRDGLINLWADPNYFDVDGFVDAFGNAPAQFLQSSFLLLKPVQNLIEKPINFMDKMDDDKFVDDFFTMETWLNDNIEVPGEVFRQFVKGLYQQNLLVQNRMPVGKHIVDLRKITCPILNIMAQNDDLVPCASSAAFNDLVSSRDRKSIIVPAGHIGLAVGTKAQKESWPEATRWLAERD